MERKWRALIIVCEIAHQAFDDVAHLIPVHRLPPFCLWRGAAYKRAISSPLARRNVPTPSRMAVKKASGNSGSIWAWQTSMNEKSPTPTNT